MSNIKLTDLYKQILDCAGMVADDEGFISVKMKKENKPALIEGKRLVMPYYNQLVAGDNEGRIIFHPLRENIMLGESEVISKLRYMINIKLNAAFGAIALGLVNIAASPDEHGKLDPYQSEMLSVLGPLTKKAPEEFTAMLLHGMANSPDKCFINLFLRRGGVIGKKKYACVGSVTFPFVEEIIKDQKTHFGTTVSKTNLKAFRHLANYIFPDVEVPEAYYRGSNSEVARFLDCLMNTVYSVGSKLNDVIALFKDLIPDSEKLIFQSDWAEVFKEDLDVLLPQIREIPMQAGNEGRARTDAPAQVQPTTTFVQPMQQTMQPQMPMQAPYGFPQQQQQPQQQQPPQVIVTERGVDFHSLMRTNPALAPLSSMPNQFQPMPPQQPVPSHLQEWARYGQQPMYGGYQSNPNVIV